MFGDLGNLDFIPSPPNEIPGETEMNRSHARNRSGIPCGGGAGDGRRDANNAAAKVAQQCRYRHSTSSNFQPQSGPKIQNLEKGEHT